MEVIRMKRKREIESMVREIRNRGGIVSVSEKISNDPRLESFLQAILDCPDCKEEGKRRAKPPAPRGH